MSDSCMYEFEDIWDDLCQSDDHIVPRPVDDSHKKPHREVTSIPYNAEARSSAGNVDQGSEKKSFSSLSKRKYKMLERDSRSHTPSGVISSSADGDTINEASSLVSKKTTFSSHVFENGNSDSHNNEVCVNDDVVGDGTAGFDNNSTDPLGNITHTDNDLDIFENAEVKDSSDFLYYGWPEIENFEDVDRIFRSCDSTFGLGASRENELGWFSSSDNVGGAEELVNSDFGFSCPESSSVENFPMNHDYLKSHCSNDTAMMTVPIRLKDGPWISEKPESYVSFVNGPTSVNDNEGFTPNAHMSEHQKQVKLQNQSVEEREENNFRNGSLDYTSSLQNDTVQLHSGAESHQAFSCQQQPQRVLAPDSCNYLQNHLLYAHSDNSPSSDLTSVIPTSSAVKTETTELTSTSIRDSSDASNLFSSMDGSHDPPRSAPAGNGKREKLHDSYGGRSPIDNDIRHKNIVEQATSSDPGSIANEAHHVGEKSENHSDIGEVRRFMPAELGSSNNQESYTSSGPSGINDVSQEASSFRQLQLVMEQLDLRTKMCIRDSLYRLARSAEQRHTYANLNSSCGDGRDASGELITEGEKSFMDIETDTNPIDRSVAHLLFHRPSESSPTSAQGSLPFKSPTTSRYDEDKSQVKLQM